MDYFQPAFFKGTILIILFSGVGFSFPNYSGVRMQIGSPESILEEIKNQRLGSGSFYSLRSSYGENLVLEIEDYFQVADRLSMSGKLMGSRNSSFILKGTSENLSGWIVRGDRNEAYEFTTDASGMMVAQEVSVSRIYPECKFTRYGQSGKRKKRMQPAGPADLYKQLPPHIHEYDSQDVKKLQSLPGAEKVIYLDITRIMDGDTPVYITNKEVYQLWQATSAALAAWKFNVTTDVDVFENTARDNQGSVRYYTEWGGSFCPLDGFGTTKFCTVRRQEDGYTYGRMANHEIGHLLGLDHDGGRPGEDGGDEYFLGFPDLHWTPIMGNLFVGDEWGDDAMYQWSEGAYRTATSQQDDLDLINRYADYHDDDITQVKPLVILDSTGIIPADSNYGQINRTSDSDQFSFTIEGNGGNVSLFIDRIEYLGGSQLDVHALIHNQDGDLAAESNVTGSRYAEFDLELEPGNYILTVQGGSEGTVEDGFTNYSSLGWYSISGSITGTSVTAGQKFRPTMGTVVFQPSPGILQVKVPESQKQSIVSLYASTGKRVFRGVMANGRIDVSRWESGVYFLKIQSNSVPLVKRIQIINP